MYHNLSHLELDVVSVLLYLDALGVLPPGLEQEVLDLLNFPRHFRFCNTVKDYYTTLN